MAETRPSTEQVRFTSAKTGEHVLDDYLEAAELGNRVLSDLMTDVWNPDGTLRADNIQFRVNNATSQLESRIGDYVDLTSGWQAVPNAYVFRNRDVYANGTTYERLDTFTYGTATFIVTEAHTAATASPDLTKCKLLVDAAGAVSSFNSRTGAIALTSGDVTDALGFTPYNASNPQTYLNAAALTPTIINNALGYTAANGATVLLKAGGTMTGDLTLANSTPSNSLHAASKGYVDSVAVGLSPKEEVVAATTANITLSAAQTIDGVAVTAGQRVLVKNQTTQSANGIYVCAAGAWTRATDADTYAELSGANVFVLGGTANGGASFVCTNKSTDGGTLGTTAIIFSQNSSPTVNAGTGLTKAGNTISVATNGITSALMAQMPTMTIRGNNTGATANALDLTVGQVQTMLGLGTAAFTASTAYTAAGTAVAKTGDTMTGNLQITNAASVPSLQLNQNGTGYSRIRYTYSGQPGAFFALRDETAGVDRLTISNTGAVDVPGTLSAATLLAGATNVGTTLTSLAAADTTLTNSKVAKTGDTMTGLLTIQKTGEQLRLRGSDEQPFLTGYNSTGATRFGYLQFLSASTTLASETGTIGLAAGGSTRLTVSGSDITASLPISQTSVGGVLQVTSSTNYGGNITVGNTLRTWVAGILGSVGSTAYNIYDSTAGQSRLAIDTSGNVTISQQLTVASNLSLTNGVLASSAGYVLTRSTNGIRIQDASGNSKGFTFFDGTGFGFLDDGSNWAARIAAGSGNFEIVNRSISFGSHQIQTGTGLFKTKAGLTPGDVGANSSVPANNVYNWGYQQAGAWSAPYPDLIIGFNTGIQFGAQTAYGGMRFFDRHPDDTSSTPAELMSIGNGDSNVRIANALYLNTNSVLTGVSTGLRIANASGYAELGATSGTTATLKTDRANLAIDGKPMRTGKGAIPYWEDSAKTSGRMFKSATQPAGMVDGDIWFQPVS